MPIYEYICNDCGYDFERLQSFSDAPIETCPECTGRVRRVISPAGVIFKGSGWYVTDSRRQLSDKGNGKTRKKEGEGGETKAAEPAPAESKAAEAKSGDAKPAATKAASE